MSKWKTKWLPFFKKRGFDWGSLSKLFNQALIFFIWTEVIDIEMLQGRESFKKSGNGSNKGTCPYALSGQLFTIDVFQNIMHLFDGSCLKLFIFFSKLFSCISIVWITSSARFSAAYYKYFAVMIILIVKKRWASTCACAGGEFDYTQGWNFCTPQKNVVCNREREEACSKSSKGSLYCIMPVFHFGFCFIFNYQQLSR